MSNDSRDRKLQDFEKRVWTTAFYESLKHTSVEGAERNAWKAVNIWHRVGVFGEASTKTVERSDSPVPLLADYEEAWKRLATRVGECRKTDDAWERRLQRAMNEFALGKIGINDLQEDLESIFYEECD